MSDTARSHLAPEPVVERVPLGNDSWVDVVRGFLVGADAVHDELTTTVAWEQGEVFRYERNVAMPRLNARTWARRAHPAMAEAGTWLDRRYRVVFDGGGLALYRNGDDSVGWHRDREMRWLEETLIGIVVLGAQRPFLVRPLTGRRAEPDDLTGVIDLSPASGDLLVLGGRCQAAWLHAVPKVRGRVGPRISAQFRWTSKRGRPDTNPGFYEARRFSSGGPKGPAGAGAGPRRGPQRPR